jgi:hypothetical protein
MIWLILGIAAWLGIGYLDGSIFWKGASDEFGDPELSGYAVAILLLAAGPLGIPAALCVNPWKHGICWNWITKPDLSASKVKWPPTTRSGSNFPCLKCGCTTTDAPPGEPLCYTHYPEYMGAIDYTSRESRFRFGQVNA